LVEIKGLAQGFVDIYKNVRLVSHGTSLSISNLNLGCTNSSVAYAEYNVEWEGGEKIPDDILPGGQRIRAIGGAVELGESVILPESSNLVIVITNKSGQASSFSIRAIWWED